MRSSEVPKSPAVRILCANLGDFVKGLDAPVRVVDEEQEPTPTPTIPVTDDPECSDKVDNDGDGKVDYGPDPGCDSPRDDDERDTGRTHPHTGGGNGLLMFGGAGLIGLAVLARRLRALV